MFGLSSLQTGAYALAIGLTIGATGTLRVMLWKADADQAKVLKWALDAERVIVKEHRVIEVKYIDKIRTIRLKGKTIVKEVPVYVTKEDDRKCDISNGFVRVFDSAILGERPGPATDSDRGPSDVALSEVGEVSAENAAAFRELDSKLDACIDAYNVVKEKVNAHSSQ